MPHEVFISYARSTSAKNAEALHRELSRLGISAFLDSVDIEYGETFPDTIASAILGCRVFVALLDATYFSRWYCVREFRIAIASYEAALNAGSESDDLSKSLAHVVIALGKGASPEEIRRLPPILAIEYCPPSDRAEELASYIQTRLREGTETTQQRHRAFGVPELQLSTLIAEALVPEPGNLAAMSVYPENLSVSLHEVFVGRENELWQLDFQLSTLREDPERTAAITAAVNAGGGFGKSRLALEFLHRFGPLHFGGALLWLDASNPQAVDPQLYGMLQVLDTDSSIPPFREFGPGELRNALVRAIRKRAATAPVLYIVDNIPEPEAGEDPFPVEYWCPSPGHVALLLTSRFRGVALLQNVKPIELSVLREEPAIRMLTNGVACVASRAQWAAIARAVGTLPLALELLNALLRAGGVTPELLLERLLRTGTTDTLDTAMNVLRGQVPAGSLKGISETLLISYERIPDDAKRAARRLSLFGSELIPDTLVTTIVADHDVDLVRSRLVNHCIVSGTPRGSSGLFGRIHRVVADFLRSQSREPEMDRCNAIASLSQALPQAIDDPAREGEMRALALCAGSLCSNLTSDDLKDHRNASDLFDVAQGLDEFGTESWYQPAILAGISLYRAMLEAWVRSVDEYLWAKLKLHLGRALSHAGQREVGRGLLEEAVVELTQAQEVFTENVHPVEWASAVEALANTHGRLGERTIGPARSAEAQRAHTELLKKRKQSTDVVSWAVNAHNAALALVQQSDSEPNADNLHRGIALYREILSVLPDDAERELVAKVKSHLGTALERVGEQESSAAHHREAIAMQNEALGLLGRDSHPTAWADVQVNLAIALVALSELVPDIATIEQALSALRAVELVYTRERSRVRWAHVRMNQADVLIRRGEHTDDLASYREAVVCARSALEEFDYASMPLDHVKATIHLGRALESAGDLERDAAQIQEAVEAYESVISKLPEEDEPKLLGQARRHLRRAKAKLQALLVVLSITCGASVGEPLWRIVSAVVSRVVS